MTFQVQEFRKHFPQLERRTGPTSLIYFDNGASTLKHSAVADRINHFNRFEVSNVHRGAHLVSREGTESYEGSRSAIQKFINANSSDEIVFTRGTTEGINLVASSLGESFRTDDEIVISSFEHHSNIVPWQILCEKKGCHLKVVPFEKEQAFDLDEFEKTLSEKTKIVSVLHYSNSFGNRLPIEEIIKISHSHGIPVLIDAAQTPLTEKIDVQKLDCDYLVFSGHKVFGPYGIGVLYGKKTLLDELPPYQGGGSMIDRVSFEKTTYAEVPQKFEAGTPNISGAIGLGSAIAAIEDCGVESFHEYVSKLRNYLKEGMATLRNTAVYEFVSTDYSGAVSFNVNGAHPSDVGTLLDKYGIAVRAGHHCTQPLMDLMGIPGTVRASLAPYNTNQEVERFIETMHKVEEFF